MWEKDFFIHFLTRQSKLAGLGNFNEAFIVSMKETLPNLVVGCFMCLWAACACSKHEKSRKEVCWFQINVTIAFSMPMNHSENFRKNQRHFQSTRNFVSNEIWQLANQWPVFIPIG